MKTPEEILKQHAPGIILFGAGDGSVHKWNSVIKAMEEYAVQCVDTACANSIHQMEIMESKIEELKNDLQSEQEENTTLRSYIEELENTLSLRNRSNPDLTIDEE